MAFQSLLECYQYDMDLNLCDHTVLDDRIRRLPLMIVTVTLIAQPACNLGFSVLQSDMPTLR